jgi:hypothetical protein
MKSLVHALFFLLTLSVNTAFAELPRHEQERHYFQFVIPKYQTQRQGGQTVSVYVRFAYQKDLPAAKYVDYKLMRADVLKYMEPTEEYPTNVYWEILARAMGRDLMKHYPLAGVSVQLIVLDNSNPDSFEPGDHGPIYTLGRIEPLNVMN